MTLLCCVLTTAFYHLHLGPSLLRLHCINNQHDFKGWGENQRIMLHDKTWFLTLTPLLKNGSRTSAVEPFLINNDSTSQTALWRTLPVCYRLARLAARLLIMWLRAASTQFCRSQSGVLKVNSPTGVRCPQDHPRRSTWPPGLRPHTPGGAQCGPAGNARMLPPHPMPSHCIKSRRTCPANTHAQRIANTTTSSGINPLSKPVTHFLCSC